MTILPRIPKGNCAFWFSGGWGEVLVLMTLESLENLFGDRWLSVVVVVDLGGRE